LNSHFFITFVSSIVVKCKIKISSYIIEKTQVTKYMLTQIINAKILTPQGWMKDGSVIIRDNKILEVTNCDLAVVGAELFDAKGMYVVPGGVEIHVHGGGGRDFMEGSEDAFRTAVAAHMQHGTTSIFPTLSSSTIPMIDAAAETCTKLMNEPDSPILGLHLEGHYLNMKMAGGQIPENIKNPDPMEYIPLVEKWDCIKRWDAAPELPGAMQFGKYITAKGILASVAHTQAEFDDIHAGYANGFTHATHFYNAMPGFHKRREYKYEGTVESIYLHDEMTVEVVADGIHVPPTILRLIYKVKGVEKACVITDALACAASDSNVAFDPRVIIEDGVCKLADRSALAGSVATMDRLIRTLVQKAEIPLEDAVRMASETPAKIMNVYDRKGSLQKDKDADILILDENLKIRAVWAMGKLVEGTYSL
jgi:N-acetylglucosamine-6-phosphate deacetylase